MNWPFALFNSVVCGLVSLPKTLPHPSSSPPVCFYKQLLCCEAPLGDPGGHGGPPRSPGRLGSSAGRVLFVAVFPMFVFSSPLCLFGRSLPCSSPRGLRNWDTFTHLLPQESALYITQTFLLRNENRIHTGALRLVSCFCVHGMRWPLFGLLR